MNRIRKYSGIGYHAECSIYSLRHKYKPQKEKRRFPVSVEREPAIAAQLDVEEPVTKWLPVERKPRIIIERSVTIEQRANKFDQFVSKFHVARVYGFV
jgi:hypothetical protein